MKRKSLRYLALAMLLPMVAVGGTARAEVDVLGGQAVADALLDVAVQKKNVSGSDEKFSEYRDVEDGFVINDFSLGLESKSSPDFLDLRIRDPFQDDEGYRLNIGRHGRYRFNLEYDSTPHNFSNGKFLWSGFGSSRLLIADSVQTSLQASEQTGVERSGGVALVIGTDPNLDTTGEDAVQQGIVRGLYAAADGVTFKLKREKTAAGFEYNLSDDAKAWLRVANENRDGARVITAGTYERWNVGSGLAHTVDRFFASGAETAEPIDYRTLTLAAGTGIYKKNWLADVEYTFTDFRNDNEALLWDNPFRITDAAQVGGVDRGRFVAGQIVLPPDSQSHDVTVSGAVDLPLHGKLAGSLSYGVITQDESFEPYTYNTAIDTDAVTPGIQSAATLARPEDDLDGEVQTLSGSLSLSLRPAEPVTVNAKYRYYDYNSKSREILFPGYAAFGESAWRTVKNAPSVGAGAPVENEVFDYTRHNADVGVEFRVAEPLTLSVEGGWEGWEFENLRLDEMDEYSIGAGFVFKPTRIATLKAGYKFSDREVDGYLRGDTAANPEARGLMNFNWAERQRHQADARLQLAPIEMLSFGISGRWLEEKYDGETEGTASVDDFRFGRTDVESVEGALDVTVAPSDRLAFYATYAREYRKEQMNNAAKDDGPKATAFFGIADSFSPVNYWNTDIYEKVDTIGVGTTVHLIPEKLILDAGYNLSLSKMNLQTYNPGGTFPTTLANAGAQDWSAVRSRLHEVNVDLGYQFTENVKAGLRYLYEWYDLDDFVWNDMQPYMAGQSVENTTRFVFTDATYDGYEAHVGGVYLTCKF